MTFHQNKPTNLQRRVILAAESANPEYQTVGPQYAHTAKLLAERG